MLSGLQLGIGPYMRDDYELPNGGGLSKKVNIDIDSLSPITLGFIGEKKGDCHQFDLDPNYSEYIKGVKVMHSLDAINAVEFQTNIRVKRIGSSQADSKNDFQWKVSNIDLESHERLIGAFGHVKKVNDELRLTSLGFIKSDCLFDRNGNRVDPPVERTSST